jgi:hypothetical protein
LPLLADLRLRSDVRVRLEGQAAWVYWLAGDRDVLLRVLAVDGAVIFEHRDRRWYRPGCHLPSFAVPDDTDARPLLSLLTPAPVAAQTTTASVVPILWRLVRDPQPRPARALCCSLSELAAWAEQATSRQMAGLEVAIDAQGQVLVMGEQLPPLIVGPRYWGRRLLLPLGWRPEPNLDENALCAAAGLRPEELGLWTPAGVDVVERETLRPLTRAAIRLATGWETTSD